MNNNQRNNDKRFDRLEALIKAEVGGLKGDVGGLKGDVGGLRAQVKAEIGGLRGEMVRELGGVKDELGSVKDELGSVTAEVRKLNIRVDTLHSQIKLVAEGHDALVDHITDVRKGIERLETGQDRLELRMLACKSRPHRV